MKSKKEFVIFTIVIVALLVITIVGIGFAYFAPKTQVLNSFQTDVSSADNMYTFESNTNANDNIEFNIDFNEMSESSANDEISVKSDTANINVSLTNPEEGMMTKCTYDIVWVWDSNDKYTISDIGLPYTDITTTKTYNYEFSAQVDEFSEEDLSKLENIDDNKIILKKELSILAIGKETKVVNHEITSRIYNLPVDQKNLFSKNFSAHIEIENVNCKMGLPSVFEHCPGETNLVSCIKSLGENGNNEFADGDGALMYHSGTITTLDPKPDYSNKDNLYVTEKYSSRYNSVDDVITIGSVYVNGREIPNRYKLAYSDRLGHSFSKFENAAEQAVKDGYLGINRNTITVEHAGDNSYRYAGNQPNNYICFGAGSEDYNEGRSETCPLTNKYRIIGLIPFDENNNQLTSGEGADKYLVKIIKAEYITANELGIPSVRKQRDDIYYTKYARIEADKSNIDGFHWNDNFDYPRNIWENSSLYKTLNNESTGYLKFLYGDNKTKWDNMIEEVKWNVGGWNDFLNMIPKQMYDAEMIDGGYYSDKYYSDSIKQGAGTQIPAKIGLMYVHDFDYASSKINWSLDYYMDQNNFLNNWLFNGFDEWTISRTSEDYNTANAVMWQGFVHNYNYVNEHVFGVRPTFYLKSDVQILRDDKGDGSRFRPYKVKL